MWHAVPARVWWILSCSLVLTGCGSTFAVSRNAPAAVSVARNSVVVAGPPGYCIDPGASRDRTEGSFVLLGSCASIARDAARPHPSEPGLLTVTVSDGSAPEDDIGPLLVSLQAFFRTEAGRAALSRDRRADSVQIVRTWIDGGVLYLHVRDAGGRARGIADDTWRALFGVNARLVTLSVNGLSAAPLSEDAGFSTLDAFTRRIRAANDGPAPS